MASAVSPSPRGMACATSPKVSNKSVRRPCASPKAAGSGVKAAFAGGDAEGVAWPGDARESSSASTVRRVLCLFIAAQAVLLVLLGLCAAWLQLLVSQPGSGESALRIVAALLRLPVPPCPVTCDKIPAVICPGANRDNQQQQQQQQQTVDLRLPSDSPSETLIPKSHSLVPAAAYSPPQFPSCRLEVLGGNGRNKYGLWPLCLDHVPRNATVYSFGLGRDISFDLDMARRGHRVFGFDPTVDPAAVQAMVDKFPDSDPTKARFQFMQVGLGARTGVVRFAMREQEAKSDHSWTALDPNELKNGRGAGLLDGSLLAPVLTLDATMASLKHGHVDLLKVDVEGVEYDICETEDFLSALDRVGQVIFELHDGFFKGEGGKRRKQGCIERLKSKGLRLVKSLGSGEYVFARVPHRAKVTVIPWAPKDNST